MSLEDAARSFSALTGLGADRLAPRAVLRLSPQARAALCRILTFCEAVGSWGRNLIVLIVLLPKPDGGLRPIGLFAAIIRLWGRARAEVARR